MTEGKCGTDGGWRGRGWHVARGGEETGARVPRGSIALGFGGPRVCLPAAHGSPRSKHPAPTPGSSDLLAGLPRGGICPLGQPRALRTNKDSGEPGGVSRCGWMSIHPPSCPALGRRGCRDRAGRPSQCRASRPSTEAFSETPPPPPSRAGSPVAPESRGARSQRRWASALREV